MPAIFLVAILAFGAVFPAFGQGEASVLVEPSESRKSQAAHLRGVGPGANSGAAMVSNERLAVREPSDSLADLNLPEDSERILSEDFKRSFEDLLEKAVKGEMGELDRKEAKRLIKDKSFPERLRFKASARMKEAELSREKLISREEKRERRVRDAKELIEEFPAQGEAYGYLLSLAKSYEGTKARELAEKLGSKAAPERIRKHARRIVGRQELQAVDLDLSKLGLAGEAPRRFIVYGWTLERPPHWLISSGQLAERGIALVGVCLDENEELASSSASDLGLGSTVVYAPGGLESEIAEMLELTMERFVYIVGPDGLDVDGHRNFGRKAASLMGLDLDLVEAAKEGGEL